MAIPKNDVLWAACADFGRPLSALFTHEGRPLDGPALLYAISGCESSFGKRAAFVKHETGYLPGGHYYTRSEELRAAYREHGVLASSSFGAFQIMYITAKELGFAGHPIELQNDRTCAMFASRLIAQRFARQGCSTLAQVLDAYNSGNAKDANVPTEYIAKGVAFYFEILKRV